MHRLQSITRLATQPSPVHLVELALLVVLLAVAVKVVTTIEITKVFVLGIVLEVFSGNWKYIPIPVPLDRALILLGFILLALRGTRAAGGRKIVLQPIHFLLVGVAAYVLANALWAGTIDHAYGLYTWLDRLGVVPFLMYTFAPRIFGTERQRNVLLVGMVGIGVYLGAEGLAEGLGVHALQLPRYIQNQGLGITGGRTRGPFLASDAMAISLFFCGTYAAIAFSLWRSRWARAVCAGVIVVAAVDIFFTLTRAAWIGAVLGIIVAMVWHPTLRRHLARVLVGGALLIAGLLVAVPGLSAKVHGRVSTQSSVWDRLNTNDAAVRAFYSHPVFGIGWQTFEQKGPAYLREAATYPLTGAGLEVHNVFLSHLAELGVVGAFLWTLALVTAIGGAIIRKGPPELWVWRIAMLAMITIYLVMANLAPLSYAFPNLLLWLTAGIVAVPRNSEAVAGTAVGRRLVRPRATDAPRPRATDAPQPVAVPSL